MHMRNSKIRKADIGHFSLLVLLLLFASCDNVKDDTSSGIETPVVKVEDRKITIYRKYPVVLEGEADIDVRPMVNGYLQEICVDEGDRVQKGDILFRIEPDIFQQTLMQTEAQLASAKANMEKARIELENTKSLYPSGVVSETVLLNATADFNTATATQKEAEAAVAKARKELDYTVIRASSDGLVGSIKLRIGTRISPEMSEPLTQLSAIDKMRAYFTLSETDYLELIDNGLLKVDTTETVLSLANGKEYPQKGRIDAINGMMKNGSIRIRATFGNAEMRLLSGSTGSVSIPVTAGSLPVIPKSSTFKTQDKNFVFVVSENGMVSTRGIIVENYTTSSFVVKSGLKAGETVVLNGTNRITDGMTIKPIIKSFNP